MASSKNRLLFWLSTIALFSTVAVFALFVRQFYYFDSAQNLIETRAAAVAELRLIVSAIFVLFAVSVLAWLAAYSNLRKSRRILSSGNAGMEKTLAELKKSGQYQNLFRHANDAILIFEPETETILEVNDKACEVYKRRREDFIGRNLKEISQNVSRGSEELEKLLHDGVYDEFESVHLRSDGAPIDLIINAAVIEYDDRTAILTINRDVTGRKRIEENLRESEEQFRSVAHSARDAIISADGRGNIVFWNEQAEIIFGHTADEAVGKSLQMIMPAAHHAAHQKGLERNVATGENRLVGKTVEVPGLRKDGTEFPLELSLDSWETAKGKFFTAIIRDITDRKAAENSLQNSERQYRFLGEGIKHQVWTSAPDGKLDYVNQRTLDYFGFSMEQVINDGWINVVHPDDVPSCVEKWTRSLETGEDYEVEFRLKRADGEYVWHLGRAAAGLDENGKIVKWFGTNSEIESQKRAEENLQKNLSLLSSTFEATADGILVVNGDNEIEIFNRQFAEMWGMSEDALRNLSEADAPRIVLEQIKNPAAYIERTKQIDVRGDAIVFDEIELTDGRIYERHSRPQKLNGAVIGRVFNFRDITDPVNAPKTKCGEAKLISPPRSALLISEAGKSNCPIYGASKTTKCAGRTKFIASSAANRDNAT